MPTLHQVQPGDCMNRIAGVYRFEDFEAIWNDSKNAQIKSRRSNPNLLFPGDAVFIPDKQQKAEARGTGQVHSFKVGQKTKIVRIALEDEEGHRLKGLDYVLRVEDRLYTGQTDGDGILKQELPLEALNTELTVAGHVWPLFVGGLNPIDKTPDQGKSGIASRLRNLGFDPGADDGSDSVQLEKALRAFAQEQKLQWDGRFQPDSAAIQTLIQKHGC